MNWKIFFYIERLLVSTISSSCVSRIFHHFWFIVDESLETEKIAVPLPLFHSIPISKMLLGKKWQKILWSSAENINTFSFSSLEPTDFLEVFKTLRWLRFFIKHSSRLWWKSSSRRRCYLSQIGLFLGRDQTWTDQKKSLRTEETAFFFSAWLSSFTWTCSKILWLARNETAP